MRSLVLVALLVGCSGAATAGSPPPVGAGSRPTRAPPVAAPAATVDAAQAAPEVKAPGNLPVMTESELAAESQARDACISACADDDATCVQTCHMQFPTLQVEVVPDAPLAPAE